MEGRRLERILVKGSRRARTIRLASGMAALFVLLMRVESGEQVLNSPVDVILWVTILAATVLLVWRERNHAIAHAQTSLEHSRFIAAAETSANALFLLDAVRDEAGEITDFEYVYLNLHAAELLKAPREELLHQRMCALFPEKRTDGQFERFRTVIQTHEALTDESCVVLEDGEPMWLRERVSPLGQGVAITVSDVTELKLSEERYQTLSSFSNSVFESAPYSIIETDAAGTIRALNSSAERLTGYTRAELVGQSLTMLHEPRELTRQVEGTADDAEPEIGGFELLTAKAAHGEVEEREWTYVAEGRVDPAGTRCGDGGTRWRRPDQRIRRDRVGHYRAQAVDDVPEPHGVARPVDGSAGTDSAARAHCRGD